MMQAARTSVAAIVKVGGVIDGTEDSAVGFVERFSGLEFDRASLQVDLRDPHLPMRLQGDIILVSENLRDDGVAAFLSGLTAVAEQCELPASALMLVEDCGQLFTTYRKRMRRRA